MWRFLKYAHTSMGMSRSQVALDSPSAIHQSRLRRFITSYCCRLRVIKMHALRERELIEFPSQREYRRGNRDSYLNISSEVSFRPSASISDVKNNYNIGLIKKNLWRRFYTRFGNGTYKYLLSPVVVDHQNQTQFARKCIHFLCNARN